MKVVVDHEVCEGHGRCELEAPEAFRLGDDDVSEVIRPTPPAELHDAVRRAAWACPKQAIRILEAD